MVAGAAPELERVRPLLEVFGRVFHVGERAGLGQLMKLANNFLSASAIAATAEAVVLGVKGGLDPAIMLEVINASTGRNTASEDAVPMPVAAAVHERWQRALAELGADADITRIVALVEQDAGAQIAPEKAAD
jgi:3-hydroxyisobutyrate dehydrogenase-like beta-hydroxyacid dehydrogenase